MAGKKNSHIAPLVIADATIYPDVRFVKVVCAITT